MQDRRPAIFIRCTGQDDNVGDVVLRRHLLDNLRPYGHLHIHVGPASRDFLAGLRLREDDITYARSGPWRRAALRSALVARTWFVDKPGELQMSWRAVLSQVRLVPLVLLIRIRHGQVLRLGVGMRAPRAVLEGCIRLIFRASTVVAWRDTSSLAAFKIGSLMPDWAMGAGGSDGRTVTGGAAPRARLVVSYRSDRPRLGATTLAAIREFAAANDLSIMATCQVRRDREMTRWLQAELQSDILDWPDDVSLLDQEKRLRAVYRTASLVLSDRLHVLIIAMTEGGTPLCMVDYDEHKIARHLAVIDYAGSVVDVRRRSCDEIVSMLVQQSRRSDACALALARARQMLDDVCATFASSAGPAEA